MRGLRLPCSSVIELLFVNSGGLGTFAVLPTTPSEWVRAVIALLLCLHGYRALVWVRSRCNGLIMKQAQASISAAARTTASRHIRYAAAVRCTPAPSRMNF